MAGYTIVNMNDLEDSAAGREGVEARFARKHLDSEHLGVSVFRYGPGHRNTLGHRHREQEEAYLVTAGSGRIKLDDEVHDLRQWDILRIGPGVMRNLEAGSDGITLVAFGSPLGEESDGEIVPGWWSDGA